MRKLKPEFTLSLVQNSQRISFKNIGIWTVLVASFAATWVLQKGIVSGTTEKFLSPPPEYLEYFHFGFRESMADSLWLRWIQDSDVCQVYDNRDLKNVEVAKSVNPLTANPRHKNCDHSWGYKMLDTISNLSPKFEMVYLAGAPSLSILVEDYEGAGLIYEKGIKQYPHDWRLLFRAAYHYQFDKQDLPRAAELLQQAGDNGAPFWVKSLAARLYTAAGQYELGITTLQNYRKSLKDDDSIKKVDARIAELKAKLHP